MNTRDEPMTSLAATKAGPTGEDERREAILNWIALSIALLIVLAAP